MKWVKVREKIAALVAIALVVIFASVGATVAGWNIPVLSDIGQALGFGAE